MQVELEAPPTPVVTEPAALEVIDRHAPLTVRWASDPGRGTIQVAVINFPESTLLPDGHTYDYGLITEAIVCSADLPAGSLEVPRELLEQLTPGAVMPGQLNTTVGARATLDPDGWRVGFVVGSS